MNSKHIALDIKTRQTITASECAELNKVAKLIGKFGAISEERLIKLSGVSKTGVLWAVWNLDAKLTSAGLYVF